MEEKGNNQLYRVSVNGVAVNPEKIRVSAMPFNRTWPGKQRDISQSEIAYMLRLYGDMPLNIEVLCDNDFKEAVVRPLSKNIRVDKLDKGIKFEIKNHGFYSVELDGEHHAIHLFYEQERDFFEYGEATHYFGAGEHYPGLIKVKNGDRIYIDKDAVVHGSIFGIDVSDVKIFGYGILDAGWEERKEKHGDIGWDNENEFLKDSIHTYGGIRFYRASDIVIDGVTVCDPASYAISFFATKNIEIQNTKVVGLWKYNNDGIDFFNCSDVILKNSFIRSFDDSICVKGITAFSEMSSENILVENCVLWCNWGLTCEIGVATACREIKNITFRNCDLIHNANCCLSINNGQWAHIHHITYENINIEYSKHSMESVTQKSEEQEYIKPDRINIPYAARVIDYRRNWLGNKSEDDPRCKNSNILFKNINLFIDEEIDKIPEIYIKRFMECSDFYDISIECISINGKQITDLCCFGNDIDEVVNLS